MLARFDLQGVERDSKNVLQSIERVFDFVIDQRQRMKNDDTNLVEKTMPPGATFCSSFWSIKSQTLEDRFLFHKLRPFLW